MATYPIAPLLTELADLGIWIQRKPEGGLRIGPTHLVRKHAVFINQLRAQKDDVMTYLESLLAFDVFGKEADDKRFATMTCPVCLQEVYVIQDDELRKVAPHLHVGEECVGSAHVARPSVDDMMTAFIEDRCVERPQVLTWTSLWESFKFWTMKRGWVTPPQPETVKRWLSQHYTYRKLSQQDAWEGLALRLEEWMGDQEDEPEADEEPVSDPERQQLLFIAQGG